MTSRLRSSGTGAPRTLHGLRDGARVFRKHSTIADAQRRFRAVAVEMLEQAIASTPDPVPTDIAAAPAASAARAGVGQERAARGEAAKAKGWRGRPPGEVELSLLTHRARELYEGRVVPVVDLARLCGVSVRTLYHHVHKQGWTRRRASVPRDLKKSERQRERYRQRRAALPSVPRGLKARDPDGQARALAGADKAGALAGVALARAISRQDSETRARILALLTRALHELNVADGLVQARARRKKKVSGGGAGRKRRKRREWRPIYVTPLPERVR